jgi:preprotein translocase subunit SecE
VDTESELRKVTWPVDSSQPKFADRYRELTQSTVIVILSVLIMAVALFLYDVVLGTVLGRLLRA